MLKSASHPIRIEMYLQVEPVLFGDTRLVLSSAFSSCILADTFGSNVLIKRIWPTRLFKIKTVPDDTQVGASAFNCCKWRRTLVKISENAATIRELS